MGIPLPLQKLSPHSLSRRVRDLLAGDLGAHRDLPVDADEDREAAAPRSAFAGVSGGWSVGRSTAARTAGVCPGFASPGAPWW